ncbi:MAG: DUF362 domain-containing protein [Methanobacteriaceae archaeon]|nr:DUF362 domain-containing protein [Methanobacteriaceae archaeon]
MDKNISKIAISKCTSYDKLKVKKSLYKSLELLGGLSNIIKPDSKVLIKPNILMASSPDACITTHPAVIEAVISALLDVDAIPMVGDSPGGIVKDNVEHYYKATGIYEVCERLDVKLLNFEKEGVYIKKRKNQTYHIAKPVIDCDFLINLPKIKTHGLTIFTSSIKNMYGAIPGLTKTDYHRKAPKPTEFSSRVVDIFALTKPDLNIVDGVVGMEGSGPSNGTPRELGMILVSEDAVALDHYICHVLGKNPKEIPTNRIALHEKLGNSIENTQILGYNPEILTDFKWPYNIYYTLDRFPSSLARALIRLWWTRPAISKKRCINCKICLESCPVDALKDGVIIPEFDYSKCINCLCCMEMCPNGAVHQDKSFLYKITSKFQF